MPPPFMFPPPFMMPPFMFGELSDVILSVCHEHETKREYFFVMCGNICNIFWPSKISNKDLYEKTGCHSVVMEIRKRRIRWLGHVPRMPQIG